MRHLLSLSLSIQPNDTYAHFSLQRGVTGPQLLVLAAQLLHQLREALVTSRGLRWRPLLGAVVLRVVEELERELRGERSSTQEAGDGLYRYKYKQTELETQQKYKQHTKTHNTYVGNEGKIEALDAVDDVSRGQEAAEAQLVRRGEDLLRSSLLVVDAHHLARVDDALVHGAQEVSVNFRVLHARAQA